jgi:hypothetical protein
MRVYVGGDERTDGLGREVEAAGRALRAHPDAVPQVEEFHSALILREAQNTSDYVQKLLDLLVLKSGGSTSDFYIQRRPGLIGALSAKFKQILWKLLRYQHERLLSQQNAVNTQLTVALQFMHEEHKREIQSLRGRIDELERLT